VLKKLSYIFVFGRTFPDLFTTNMYSELLIGDNWQSLTAFFSIGGQFPNYSKWGAFKISSRYFFLNMQEIKEILHMFCI
jgi:hypothetical protein